MPPVSELPVVSPTVTGAVAPACANCHAPLNGHFCAACGAPALEGRPLTVRRFRADLWNEVTNADSVTVRTVIALFRRPGLLTRDYLAGRTRWYLPPLRVYLLAFAIMIFARTATHADVRIERELRAKITAVEAENADLATIRERRARTQREMPKFTEPLTRAQRAGLSNPWLHLIDPITVAAVLALLYRARRRSYAEHVVFALHLLAFNCILSVVTTWLHAELSASMSRVDAISVLHWAAFGTYAYLAVRRLHEESRSRSAIKSAALVAGAQAAMAVVPILTALVVMTYTVATLK